MKATRSVEVERAHGEDRDRARDELVVEEPLEIRIADETLAVTMRTPGADGDLVLGFLFAEGIIASAGDVLSVAPCGRIGDESRENTVVVTLAPGVQLPQDELGALARRGTITTSACGVCGRRSIEDLRARCTPMVDTFHVARATVHRAVAGLRDRQAIFERTGGCHAAALARRDGSLDAVFEDVGRHNAVDKLIGSRLRSGALPLADAILVVSGRASFEIVQKAIVAGVPIVVSVSAASSLAVDLAQGTGVTLVGFARGDAMTIYAGSARIE